MGSSFGLPMYVWQKQPTIVQHPDVIALDELTDETKSEENRYKDLRPRTARTNETSTPSRRRLISWKIQQSKMGRAQELLKAGRRPKKKEPVQARGILRVPGSQRSASPKIKADRHSMKSAGKSAEKALKKPKEKLPEKNRRTEKSKEKLADDTGRKPAENSGKKPADYSKEKPGEKAVKKPGRKSVEKPGGKPTKKPNKEVAKKPERIPGEKPDEKSAKENQQKLPKAPAAKVRLAERPMYLFDTGLNTSPTKVPEMPASLKRKVDLMPINEQAQLDRTVAQRCTERNRLGEIALNVRTESPIIKCKRTPKRHKSPVQEPDQTVKEEEERVQEQKQLPKEDTALQDAEQAWRGISAEQDHKPTEITTPVPTLSSKQTRSPAYDRRPNDASTEKVQLPKLPGLWEFTEKPISRDQAPEVKLILKAKKLLEASSQNQNRPPLEVQPARGGAQNQEEIRTRAGIKPKFWCMQEVREDLKRKEESQLETGAEKNPKEEGRRPEVRKPDEPMKIESMTIENLKIEGLKIEGLKIEGLKREDLKREDLKREDLKREDLKREDLKREDWKMEGLKMEGLKVESLTVEGLKVKGLKVKGLKVEGLKVEGLKVEGLKVEGLKVEGLNIGSIQGLKIT